MLYAKVVLGISVEGPFDYAVGSALRAKARPGARVVVPFRTQEKIGYIVKLTRKTSVKNVKSIISVIDDIPVLSENLLLLTRDMADYYCCSWGEAIETALPEGLRKGKAIPKSECQQWTTEPRIPSLELSGSFVSDRVFLLHCLDTDTRWQRYIEEIKTTLSNNKSAIVLLPEVQAVLRFKEAVSSGLNCPASVQYRRQSHAIEEWAKVKGGRLNVVVGTRASIFAPVQNLGLVIIDEEHSHTYKQEQVPHYHAREVAFMRTKIENSRLILGSSCPTVESFYLASESRIAYEHIPSPGVLPEITIIDVGSLPLVERKKNIIFSVPLLDSVMRTVESKRNVLFFLNRRGFATVASCNSCGKVLRCPRCNANLVFHFKNNVLSCHYCNFTMPPPQMCPDCNAGYIRYSGAGTEKLESELSRTFPQAKIKVLEEKGKKDIGDADICIATESIFTLPPCRFGLIAVVAIDNSLNRIDFRAAEKTFWLLTKLMGLAQERIIMQTRFPLHHVFRALAERKEALFYKEELRQRQQLLFPPYRHLAQIKLRGKKESKVRDISSILFSDLTKVKKQRKVKIISVNPGQPPRLRGNFYWQILVRSRNVLQMSKFLKMHLKDFRHSGIIVTVDVDPL